MIKLKNILTEAKELPQQEIHFIADLTDKTNTIQLDFN